MALLESITQLDIQTFLSMLATAITGSAAWILFARRKYFKDTNEITKGIAETDLIHLLEKQLIKSEEDKEKLIKRCELIDAERLLKMEQIYKLSSEIENLSNQLIVLKDLISNLSSTLEIYKNRLKELEIKNLELMAQLKIMQ